uniref:alpha-N-acetylgalactosaminide alpha-2,6-sialyltransferase n=1 Tax=Meleagris gallopavo TaxID=9103 RepID=A0A803YJV0_MELGA
MRRPPGGRCWPPAPTLCSGRCARSTGLLLTLLALLLLFLLPPAQRSLQLQLSRYGGAVGWERCGPLAVVLFCSRAILHWGMINPEPACACPLFGFCARCSSWPWPGAQRGGSEPSSCFLFCGVGMAPQCPDGCGQSHSSTALLKSSLSLLNASSSALLFDIRPLAASCIRCAVVGNGGILHGSGMGPTIDAHDYVFRVNGAITEGFEHDVGSRTSFYVFSTNTMVNALHSYAADGFRHPPQTPETCYVFLPDHDRDYLLLRAALSQQRVDSGRDEGVHPQEFFGEDLQVGKFRMLHPDFIRYLRNRFLRSHILATPHWQLYRPSTGAVMLLTAIHTCDQVSAFGFMTPGYRAYSDHYFDRGHKEVQFFINHDLRMEMQLWQRLQRSRILWLYTGSEGT